MREKLGALRARFAHPGNKGAIAEETFREFLREYLPRRLAVGHGEVIDSQGGRSGQVDIVVATDDHPFTFSDDAPGLFLIEGTVGVGEVKSLLTGEELTRTIHASKKVRELKPEIGVGTMAHSNPADLRRFYSSPPYFLFAYESRLSLSTIRERLQEEGRQLSSPIAMIDAVYVLGRGWVVNFGDGDGAFQFRTPAGESVRGWVEHETESVLLDFMTWLSIVMPRTIRFEPMLVRYTLPATSFPARK